MTAAVLVLVLFGCAGLDGPAPTTGATETTPMPSTATERTTTVAPEGHPGGTSHRVEVVAVVDGDTYAVEFPNGHIENVRLLGVDTPEVHAENAPDESEGILTT